MDSGPLKQQYHTPVNQPTETSKEQFEKRMETAAAVLDEAMHRLRSAAEAPSNRDERLESARAEARRYRELVDGIDAVVWEANRDGRILFVNRKAGELFGYPDERWLSLNCFWYEIAHPGDRDYARGNFFACARDGQERQQEYRMIAADGRTIWVREGLRAARGSDGQIERIRGVIWNIARRKKIERKLQIARSELADELADLMHLHELFNRLWGMLESESLLQETLTAAMAIQGSEIGILRLFDPARDELGIAASLGLPERYVDRYARAPSRDLACGLAILAKVPWVIEDVDADAAASPYREEFRTGGYRAQYTTLLTGRTGEILGTVTSCFRDAHRPPQRQIRLVELFVRQASVFVENARFGSGAARGRSSQRRGTCRGGARACATRSR